MSEPVQSRAAYHAVQNNIRYVLLFVASCPLWAVLFVHLSYHPVLVFSMIGAYNQRIRNYWSFLEGQSAEYGIWPGLWAVLSGEIFRVFTVTLGITLAFWALRRWVFKHRDPLSETFGKFAQKQLFTLLWSGLAVTGGAILIGGSFVFGQMFQTPISLQIETIIEIAASALLLFSLFYSVMFWWLDLEQQVPHARRTGLVVMAAAGLLTGGALGWWSSQAELRVLLTSEKPLPPVQWYAIDYNQPRKTQGDLSLHVVDQRANVGQTSFGKQDGELFWWRINFDNYWRNQDDQIMVWRHLYMSGPGIEADLPAFFHKRPDHLAVDWRQRRIEISYQVEPRQIDVLPWQAQSAEALQRWRSADANWHSRELTGPLNQGWSLEIETDHPELKAVRIYAQQPLKLDLQWRNGQTEAQTVPFDAPVRSIRWQRGSGAQLWVNQQPVLSLDIQPVAFAAQGPVQHSGSDTRSE